MMLVEFIGGPCDGEQIGVEARPEDVYFLIASGHRERPVYRMAICSCCAAKMVASAEVIDYVFIGYEKSINESLRMQASDGHVVVPELDK